VFEKPTGPRWGGKGAKGGNNSHVGLGENRQANKKKEKKPKRRNGKTRGEEKKLEKGRKRRRPLGIIPPALFVEEAKVTREKGEGIGKTGKKDCKKWGVSTGEKKKKKRSYVFSRGRKNLTVGLGGGGGGGGVWALRSRGGKLNGWGVGKLFQGKESSKGGMEKKKTFGEKKGKKKIIDSVVRVSQKKKGEGKGGFQACGGKKTCFNLKTNKAID